MRSLGQFCFFTKRFHTHKKHKTHKSKQKQKRQRFYVLEKHLRGRKSLIHLFPFCAFYVLFVRVKSFCKKKQTSLMISYTLLLLCGCIKLYYILAIVEVFILIWLADETVVKAFQKKKIVIHR